MTSNSPEDNNTSTPRGGRPTASDPRGIDGAASVPLGASVNEARRAGSPSDASPRARTTPSGDAAASTPSTTASEKAKDKGTKKGTKSGTSASSGGDWNVFRTVVVIVGVIIAGFGAYYLILGTAGLPDTEADPVNPTLESQFRFFSAMMVGVGAAFITIAIKFEWANMLWLVCLMVFVGGIGRVLSWAFSGTPNYVMIILMVVELAFPPALLVWHKYIAKTSSLRTELAQRG